MSNTAKLIQEMQTYYHHRAALYDVSMGYDQPETVMQLTPVIERLRQLVTDKKVLEIACGPCFWTQQIYDCTHSILATDFNQSVLNQAAMKKLSSDKVQMQQADAYQLDGVPSNFEVALAIDWLSHVPKTRLQGFLKNLHRHVQGMVIFCDQLPGPQSQTDTFDEEGNHLQQRTLPDSSSYTVIKHFFCNQEINSIFTPFTPQIAIERFPQTRRLLIHYPLIAAENLS
ncbi:class I SAM-dependent methyltransferase [Acaryochloris sp. IP29b_bin.137]|uniref:class I SAM-dependent methyltransferase n=1 Tax=Acaryochloris sp. IP29b_bin.137 TaxID=2969217 RepID=UPI00261DDDD1|nr:class I SAM-dependent methyltransferase [Acaryochloris sp. IP29b_bin.137]